MNSRRPVVSIIINNYDYGRFLGDAIESALAQTYDPLEVIVVDDGSTDQSRDVIESYRDRIIPVLKDNGGQGSAFNSGFLRSSGDIVIFLDADDALLPDALDTIVKQFHQGVSKVHWPLWRADENLKSSGLLFPPDDLPAGDLRDFTFAEGPSTTLSTVTSANAFSRTFLQSIMPIPEAEHRISADGYVCGLAPAYGLVGRVVEPLGLYRIHTGNNYKRMPVHERIERGVASMERQWDTLESHARSKLVETSRERWTRNSYFHRLRCAVDDIERLVAAGESLILFDAGQWGLEHSLDGRIVFPFLGRDGDYWGTPENDAHAITEFDRLRSETKATFFVVGWPAFWWADEYAGFADYLSSRFKRAVQSDELTAYDLRGAA